MASGTDGGRVNSGGRGQLDMWQDWCWTLTSASVVVSSPSGEKCPITEFTEQHTGNAMPLSTSFPLNTLSHSASIMASPAEQISATFAPGLHILTTAANVAASRAKRLRLRGYQASQAAST